MEKTTVSRDLTGNSPWVTAASFPENKAFGDVGSSNCVASRPRPTTCGGETNTVQDEVSYRGGESTTPDEQINSRPSRPRRTEAPLAWIFYVVSSSPCRARSTQAVTLLTWVCRACVDLFIWNRFSPLSTDTSSTALATPHRTPSAET